MIFQDVIREYSEQPITKQVALNMLKSYKRPYDKIAELVKQGMLVPVKKGFYIPGPNSRVALPEPFLLANHLLGPSYVSMDSALSYLGFIPERVYEICSVTTMRAAEYKTPVGRFSYIHMPLPYYSFGIQKLVLTQKQTVLIATPEKALCDKIISTSGLILRSSKQAKQFLLEDLRMDRAMLLNLNYIQIGKWIKDAPKRASLDILIKTLKEI
jgi:hypothetical protein